MRLIPVFLFMALSFILVRCGKKAEAVSVTKCRLIYSQPVMFWGEMCPWEKGFLSVGFTYRESFDKTVQGEPPPGPSDEKHVVTACVTAENSCEFQ